MSDFQPVFKTRDLFPVLVAGEKDVDATYQYLVLDTQPVVENTNEMVYDVTVHHCHNVPGYYQGKKERTSHGLFYFKSGDGRYILRTNNPDAFVEILDDDYDADLKDVIDFVNLEQI